MEKYKFHQYTSSEFDCDPIFKEKQFEMFGHAGCYGSPILFVVNRYRYVIVDPINMLRNEELVYRIGVYLYHHETKSNELPVTYFFGDISKCKEISEEFTSQAIRLVSQEMIDEWFPKNINEINQKIIQYFLAKQTHYGQEFEWTGNDKNKLFFISPNLDSGAQYQEYSFITAQIFKKGLVSKTKNADNRIWFVVSEEAIELYQNSEKNSKNNNLAFIAIKFKYNEERIEAIQKAIALAGYEPRIMSEYETNNWIMPEIFHQIKLSKFVVVDLSIRCDGAYYEAGYAYALGKEVIHLYDNREQGTNPLHFDVAQKSTVMYNDYDELVEKLVARIKATVN
jgi:nucleoside 2-deoxyribosyltransferase